MGVFTTIIHARSSELHALLLNLFSLLTEHLISNNQLQHLKLQFRHQQVALFTLNTKFWKRGTFSFKIFKIYIFFELGDRPSIAKLDIFGTFFGTQSIIRIHRYTCMNKMHKILH